MFRHITFFAILKGLLIAIGITLLSMAVLAGLVISTPVPDRLLTTLNQLMKVVSIFCGAVCAVGWGGSKGFALGAVCGLLYMVMGYLIYSIVAHVMAPAPQMALEFLLGALIGALSGAIAANAKPVQRKVRKSM